MGGVTKRRTTWSVCLIALVATCVGLIHAGSAGATTFCVTASGENLGCAPDETFTELQAALGRATNQGGPDKVLIGRGTFAGPFCYMSVDPLEIVGSGPETELAGSAGSCDPVLSEFFPPAVLTLHNSFSLSDRIEISRVKVRIPGVRGATGVVLAGAFAREVEVTSDEGAVRPTGVVTGSNDATFTSGSIDLPRAGSVALRAKANATSITRSQIRAVSGVIGTVDGTNEVQTIAAGDVAADGGTYTLAFGGQQTAPVPFDADAATIALALEDLPIVEPDEIDVTGGPLFGPGASAVRLTFQGNLASRDMPLVGIDAAGVTGPGAPYTNPTVAVTRQGGLVLEYRDFDGDGDREHRPVTRRNAIVSISSSLVEAADAQGALGLLAFAWPDQNVQLFARNVTVYGTGRGDDIGVALVSSPSATVEADVVNTIIDNVGVSFARFPNGGDACIDAFYSNYLGRSP